MFPMFSSLQLAKYPIALKMPPVGYERKCLITEINVLLVSARYYFAHEQVDCGDRGNGHSQRTTPPWP